MIFNVPQFHFLLLSSSLHSCLRAIRQLQKNGHIPSDASLFKSYAEYGHFVDVRVAALDALIDYTRGEARMSFSSTSMNPAMDQHWTVLPARQPGSFRFSLLHNNCKLLPSSLFQQSGNIRQEISCLWDVITETKLLKILVLWQHLLGFGWKKCMMWKT